MTKASGRFDYSVLVVGSGPVGLALACELGMRGVDCLLVEKRDGSVTLPKMSVVTARGMEFCRRWGIAEQVRSAVWSENHALDIVYLGSLRGNEYARLTIPSYRQRGKLDLTPEGACHCPQIYFDPILAAHVRSLPSVTTRYFHNLDSFAQDADGVSAKISDTKTGAVQELRVRYLIGCDGANGLVRDALGIKLEGLGVVANSTNIFFRAPELSSFHDKGWARIYRVIDETGCWSELIPIDGNELWRLTVFDDPRGLSDPDGCLRRMAGADFPYEMISVLGWERGDFIAASYGHGRVFIAGDSAHQSSPTGGLGMHTGMEEAVNLGWKLEAMVKGWGAPKLLDSYEPERKPIAVRNVDLSTRSYHGIVGIPGMSEASGGDDSCATAKAVANWKSKMNVFSIGEHIKTQVTYENSPVCISDGTPPPLPEPKQYEPSTRPGARAPHAWIADNRSTLDEMGEGFVLFDFSSTAEGEVFVDAARRLGVPLRRIAIDNPAVAATYQKKYVLVRPDGHVAWRDEQLSLDPQHILDRCRGF